MAHEEQPGRSLAPVDVRVLDASRSSFHTFGEGRERALCAELAERSRSEGFGLVVGF